MVDYKNYWKDKEHVIEESKKYNCRSDFNKFSRKAYEEARKNKWLDEMTWLNSKNVYVDKVDTVYKYNFKEKNAVYIGRTVHIDLRDYQHRTVLNDSVYKFAKENNLEIPKMEIIESQLTVPEGVNREIYWEQYYRDNGYTIINQKACGSIGSMAKGKWSKNKCFEESKKYTTRNEFFKYSNPAYQKSLKEGWINEMTWLSNAHSYPRGFWAKKENVLEEARKYNSKKEFEENNISAFLAAHRYGFIKEMTWLVKQEQHPKNYWDNDRIKKEASKYKSKTEFANKNRAAYNAAKRLNIIDNFFPNKAKKAEKVIKDTPNNKLPKGYWKNRDNMMSEARKYKTKEEFQKGNLTAFLAAYRYGYIDEMVWLIRQKQHKKGYWTYKHIEEEALKYDTKTDFYNGNQTAYRAALKMGVIDDFFVMNDYVQ